MRTGLLYEKYRRRNVENVMNELELLYKDFSIKKILFFDDNFAQNEDWVIEFCNALIQSKMEIEWICNARVDTITGKMLKEMAESGCSMILYGIESGNQELLDYINKGISIEQVKDAVRLTREFGIKTCGYFMLALPGESPEMGKKTVQLAIDLDLDLAQFTPTRMLPGTRLYEICKKEGTISDDPYEFYDTSVSGPMLVPKIKFVPGGYQDKKAVAEIIKFAYRKFFFRFGYLWKIIKNGKFLKRSIEYLGVFKRLVFYKAD